MAPPLTSQILFALGGKSLTGLGTLPWRKSPPAFGGEIPYTFARADGGTPVATHTDYDSIIRYAAQNVLRLGWVDLNGDGIRETLTLLQEAGGTNGWTKSEQLDDAAWTKTGATVLVDNGAAPDGTTSADYLKESALNEFHFFSRTTPALTDNTLSTVTLHGRPSAGARWFRFVTVDKANVQRSTWFNPSTGLVGTKDAGHTVFIEGPFTGPSGTPYYRFGVSFNSASGATPPQVQVILATGDNAGAYAGDGASGLLFWGMQFEADKPFPSSYVKTTTAAVARTAEATTVPFNWGSSTDITVLARVARPVWADVGASYDLGVWPGVWSLGKTNPNLEIYFDRTSRFIIAEIRSAGLTRNVNQPIPAGAEIDICAQFKNLASVGGGQVALDVGSGFGAFSAVANPIPNFGDQLLRVAAGLTTNILAGNLISLIFAKGLFSRSDMLAIPL